MADRTGLRRAPALRPAGPCLKSGKVQNRSRRFCRTRVLVPYESVKQKSPSEIREASTLYGGPDGTRTRDLRRDRPAF